MTPQTVSSLGVFGAAMALAISAIGSAIGIGIAGMAAIGAWKKCFAANRPAPLMQMVIFVGAPITQTFYGLIAMMTLRSLATSGAKNFPELMAWGLFGGLAIALSSIAQGKIAACAADAFAETGQGFTNYLLALGIIESVAIFVMAFIFVFAK